MSFRIAVIGCGYIAMHEHGPAYHKYTREHADTQLVACCDVLEERAVEFSARYGFFRTYADWRAMLAQERPDAVCLNIPPAQTAQVAGEILRMGFPLLLEKPPGLTEDEVDGLIRAAEQGSAPNQVAFNRRYTPLVVRLKEQLAALGEQAAMHTIRYSLCRVGRADADFSTTAVHGIDTARFLTGCDYVSLRLHYQELAGAGPGVANILIDCVFRSGALGQLQFCPMSGAVVERAEVHALRHSFFLNLPVGGSLDAPGRLLHLAGGKVVDDTSGPAVSAGEAPFLLNGFYQEDAQFFEDIRCGRAPLGDIRSGRQPVIIAQALRERREQVIFS